LLSSDKKKSQMKPLKVFAIGAEATVVFTLAVASYHVAFAGTSSASDWLAGAPILTVMALESLRLPVALDLFRSKLLGFLLSCSLLAGVSVATGEAAIIAYENLIFQRTRPVAEAERDLKKAETARDDILKGASKRYDDNIVQLNAALEKARAHQTEIAKTPVTQHQMPDQLPMPPAYQSPAPQPIPLAQTCKLKKGGTYICNAAARDKVIAENADADRKAREAYDKARNEIIERNSNTQEQVNQQNKEAQERHDKDLSDADEAVKTAQRQLAAVGPAPDMSASDKDVEAARQKVIDAREMNPMFRVAAAWQKIPVQDLTLGQFEAVKSWAVFALAVTTAVTSALAGIIASLPERGTGRPSKLNRMFRAWIARKRRKIYRDVPVPGPETIKEVEVVKEVPGPVEYREKIEYRDVPGPIEYRNVEKLVYRDVPGPIEYRDVEKIVNVPGPIEYRDVEKIVNVPGPVEYRDIEKIVYRDVPGPERTVEKVVVKWVPYDVTSGLRVKPDGSLGEVAQIRAAQ
jgi:hypothetical protein